MNPSIPSVPVALVILVLRARGLVVVAVGAALSCGLGRLAASPIAVAGRPGVAMAAWPLAPVALAVVVPGVAGGAFTPPEVVARRSAPARKLVRLALVAMAAAVVVVVLGPAAGHSAWVPARSTALLVGLALVGVAVAEGGVAWIAPVAMAVACWFLGPRTGADAPAGWAVLLAPARSMGAGLAAVAILALGVVGYLVRERSVAPRTAVQ